MPVVPLYDKTKKKVGEINLDERVFNVPLKKHLLYDAVIAHGVNARQGTASTKTRAEVKGGGKKPFRQKGTGRARQGSSRDAHQVGGGVAFGPRPREYKDGFSKEANRGALRTVLSQLCKEDRIFVLKDFTLEKIKTKNVVSILKKFSLEKGLIIDQPNEPLQKSTANLRHFKFLRPEGVNVYDLIKFQHVMISEPAILHIEKRLQP
ncbi:MAG TPA: 50S ribosomal protein L4 [Holosporales bacterium]|nr:MAG: 50S ribosomal protein L4 [Deltaproteobacteria bacterium GWA2_38_16]OGQ03784.1 MAG: 50S ribosomal protein L4 [Deltaproteobacteria bacterium RIFCSPHIGHO2_02_FULL_38_15]OGQ59132.1 MAG: 50S ribosomal protein L4 [Deltaproteobacteria bacterium RIFCSPLOWO2_12_FULL_38_8]HBQ20823.1 50S ribosomal protein L4 [Deltaproteobacteria bacterium]HCC24682.1 50S ribosomal protein L4 [Holosporales bacterium]